MSFYTRTSIHVRGKGNWIKHRLSIMMSFKGIAFTAALAWPGRKLPDLDSPAAVEALYAAVDIPPWLQRVNILAYRCRLNPSPGMHGFKFGPRELPKRNLSAHEQRELQQLIELQAASQIGVKAGRIFAALDPLTAETDRMPGPYDIAGRCVAEKTFIHQQAQHRQTQHQLFLARAGQHRVTARERFVADGTEWFTITCPHCQKDYTHFTSGPTTHGSIYGCGKPIWIEATE